MARSCAEGTLWLHASSILDFGADTGHTAKQINYWLHGCNPCSCHLPGKGIRTPLIYSIRIIIYNVWNDQSLGLA